MPRKLAAFRGRLPPNKIADGMNAAVENARRLIADAELLLANERYATAVALAALAIEESGKVAILRSLALAKTQAEAADCWRDYRSHTRKNAGWIFSELFSKGARRLEEFSEMYRDDAEHPFVPLLNFEWVAARIDRSLGPLSEGT